MLKYHLNCFNIKQDQTNQEILQDVQRNCEIFDKTHKVKGLDKYTNGVSQKSDEESTLRLRPL